MGCKTTWVVVLGDFGRSPRMQYHALSLAQQAEQKVCVLAHQHSKPISDILADDRISLWAIRDTPLWIQAVPTRGLRLLIKALVQVLLLSYCLLWQLPRPDTILVQTPPAIPTLALCSFACWWYGALLVVDWHNFGYSIMAMTMGPAHVLVRVARWYECVLGRRGHKHLCVSKAMQRFLRDQWHISAVVLYDTPPAWFQRASNEQAHDLLVRLAPTLIHLTLTLPAQNQQQQQVLQPERRQQQQLVHQQRTPVLEPAQQQVQQGVQQQQQAMADAAAGHRPKPPVPWLKGGNPFTEVVKGRGQWRANRPALIVSSTSWTADEDFGILLEAGILYDKEAQVSSALPNLVILVTGKGPQKAMYERNMQQLDLQHVAFRTAWLEAADYPILLGSADLGISLHTSSSELDLPMKIVDMFGCGLPVCAARYSCIDELVSENSTGLLFDCAQELSLQLVELLQGFPHRPSNKLQHMQQNIQQNTQRWPTTWAGIAPIFT